MYFVKLLKFEATIWRKMFAKLAESLRKEVAAIRLQLLLYTLICLCIPGNGVPLSGLWH